MVKKIIIDFDYSSIIDFNFIFFYNIIKHVYFKKKYITLTFFLIAF